MERAEARKLQPYFIRSFFLEAFTLLGGEIRERETGRFEITRVPAELRQRDRQIGRGTPLLRRYERVTFDRGLVTLGRHPLAQYLAPGHPLLDVTIDLVIERFDSELQRGAVLVDERDPGDEPYTLVYLQHAVTDGLPDQGGNRRAVSKRFEFVRLGRDGTARSAGWAPYLDLRPATEEELALTAPLVGDDWVRGSLEDAAVSYGITLARQHLDEVRRRNLERVDRVTEAVRSRLAPEIAYWEHRAAQLRERELAGKLPSSGMNSANARQRAEELKTRLRSRLDELQARWQLSSVPPVVAGGALVIPVGLLSGRPGVSGPADGATRAKAMELVMTAERSVGRVPARIAEDSQGYDIESRRADGGQLFISVKVPAGGSFIVSQSEIGVARNTGDRHVLALVDGDHVRYWKQGLDTVADVPFGKSDVALPWRTFFEHGREPR
jgi:hypothetical protein